MDLYFHYNRKLKRYHMNRINICLHNRQLWRETNNMYWRGDAFYSEKLLDFSRISDDSSIRSIGNFASFLKNLNGFFALICQTEGTIFAAVDKVRSIPLFYSLYNGDFYLSDSAHWIKEEIKTKEINPIFAAEFMLTGYVTGNDTLIPEIKQILPGEILILEKYRDGLKMDTFRYFMYTPGKYSSRSEAELLTELERTLIRVFDRLIDYASGRTIVVPLSGGYDSRLIALMLKKLGYEKIISFSYGKPGNKDSEISRNVARLLGIQWVFIPYSNESWYSWYRSDEFRKYSEIAFELSSVPVIQDWPAIWELQKKDLVPDDSIFVPGHGGDILSGRVAKKIENQPSDPIEDIIKQNYTLWRCTSTKCMGALKERIKISFNNDSFPCERTCFAESWRIKERHTKFIINSVRAYEFWGYNWWIPFWDSDFMNFWSRVPLNMKIDQRIYKTYVNNLFEKITNTKIETTHREEKWRLLVSNSAIRMLKISPFYLPIRRIYRQFRLIKEYDSNPNAFYGAIQRKKFKNMFTGTQNINSFIAADIMESLSIESENAKKIREWILSSKNTPILD